MYNDWALSIDDAPLQMFGPGSVFFFTYILVLNKNQYPIQSKQIRYSYLKWIIYKRLKFSNVFNTLWNVYTFNNVEVKTC